MPTREPEARPVLLVPRRGRRNAESLRRRQTPGRKTGRGITRPTTLVSIRLLERSLRIPGVGAEAPSGGWLFPRGIVRSVVGRRIPIPEPIEDNGLVDLETQVLWKVAFLGVFVPKGHRADFHWLPRAEKSGARDSKAYHSRESIHLYLWISSSEMILSSPFVSRLTASYLIPVAATQQIDSFP